MENEKLKQTKISFVLEGTGKRETDVTPNR